MKFPALSVISCPFIFTWIAIYAATSSASDMITVTTIVDQPWVKVKKEHPASNEDFEGFIPDLLKSVAQRIGSNYTLKLVDDKKYGQYDNRTKTWNGMVGELVRGRADVAASALTISAERASAIDFTEPFMTFDSAILLLKTPDGRHERISSCADLVKQHDMTYGVLRGGLTESMFDRLQEEPYREMAARMKKNPTFNVDNTAEGVTKVRNSRGDYALILDGPTAEFVADTQPCDLHYVNLKLESRSLAWGLRKDFHLRDSINRAMTALKNNGELDAIDRKWRKRNVCSSFSSSSSSSSSSSFFFSSVDPRSDPASIRSGAVFVLLMTAFHSM